MSLGTETAAEGGTAPPAGSRRGTSGRSNR
jgi:hypothetical protein